MKVWRFVRRSQYRVITGDNEPLGTSTGWTRAEPEEVIAIFSDMLRLATGDGAKKRQAGLKPSWKVDDSHMRAFYRHMRRFLDGETLDADSGADPRIHCAWRLLAAAWRDANPVAASSELTRTLVRPTDKEPF